MIRNLQENEDVEIADMNPEQLNQKMLFMQVQGMHHIQRLVESIPSFAKDNDESEWRILTDPSANAYTESDLEEMRSQGDKLYYTDPSARGLIEAMVNFVIGKEVTMLPQDEDDDVRKYWEHFWLINKMDERIKEMLRRTLRTGDCFLRFFDLNPSLTYVNDFPIEYQIPIVRFVHPNEIVDPSGSITYGIQTDEDDIETPIQYIRKKPLINGSWGRETIPADRMIHIKYMVDSDVKRGMSFYVGIAKYIQKYSQWLNDRIILNKIRTVFNMVMTVNGVPSNFAEKFETATTPAGITQSTSTTQKKMPNRGSVLVASSGVEYDFKNLQINAQDTKDDGRAIELMLSKGTGFTEYITRGDASNANYASSMVSESPMVRTFEGCQDFFAKPLQHLYRKVIRYGVEHGQIPSITKRTIVTVDKLTGAEDIKEETGPINRTCTINYEALIHRDVKAEAEAFAIHSERRWDSDRGITTKLGNDYETVQTEIRREEIQNAARLERQSAAEFKAEEEANAIARTNKNPDDSGDET